MLKRESHHTQDIDVVEKVLEPWRPGQELHAWHQLAKWPQVSYPASLSLGFSTCKVGMAALALKFCYKSEIIFIEHKVGT